MTSARPFPTTTQLAELLHCARPHASPVVLGLLLLEREACAKRMALNERAQVVQDALDDGNRRADALASQFNSRQPATLTRKMNVAVTRVQGNSRHADTLFFAEYTAKPPVITLFDEAIARIDRHLRHKAVATSLGMSDSAPAFIAHELYHHLDANSLQPISQRHRVTMLKVGAWRLTNGIPALAEIGAGAFSQRLLRLPMHLIILNLVARYDENAAFAQAMLAETISLSDSANGISPAFRTANEKLASHGRQLSTPH